MKCADPSVVARPLRGEFQFIGLMMGYNKEHFSVAQEISASR